MIIDDLLLTFVDLGVEIFDIFDAYNYYKKPIDEYQAWRQKYSVQSKEIYRLKKNGYLESDNKEIYSLTPKAVKRLQHLAIENLKISIPSKWDRIWRIVVFDIPEKEKHKREVFRRRLNNMGFVLLQKSVFCYPHECLKEITYVIKTYEIEPYVTFFESKRIITGKDLIKIFTERDILRIQ